MPRHARRPAVLGVLPVAGGFERLVVLARAARARRPSTTATSRAGATAPVSRRRTRRSVRSPAARRRRPPRHRPRRPAAAPPTPSVQGTAVTAPPGGGSNGVGPPGATSGPGSRGGASATTTGARPGRRPATRRRRRHRRVTVRTPRRRGVARTSARWARPAGVLRAGDHREAGRRGASSLPRSSSSDWPGGVVDPALPRPPVPAPADGPSHLSFARSGPFSGPDRAENASGPEASGAGAAVRSPSPPYVPARDVPARRHVRRHEEPLRADGVRRRRSSPSSRRASCRSCPPT